MRLAFIQFLYCVAAVQALPSGQTFCDYYTKRMFGNASALSQNEFVTVLVRRWTYGNWTRTNPRVPGELAGYTLPDGTKRELSPYFDGTLATANRKGVPTAVNFKDAGGIIPVVANNLTAYISSNQLKLANHQYQFYAKFMNCSLLGTPEFLNYEGEHSMFEVHRFMRLTFADINYLLEQMVLTFKSFDIPARDSQPFVDAINSTFNRRCSPPIDIFNTGKKHLPSICYGSDCPLAANPDCKAYQKVGVEGAAVSENGSTANTDKFVVTLLFVLMVSVSLVQWF